MLVRFSLENWMSFRSPVTFTMVASKERQHGERVPHVAKYQTRIVPIAAIYGGNASGKTNFFRALAFAKGFVVKGSLPDALIAVVPFRLEPGAAERPTRFAFEILVDDDMYEFAFAVTARAVVEERLVLITRASEKVLYERRGPDVTFDASLAKDQLLQFAFKGTRDNQLFLTNAVSQRVDVFRPVYEWFRDTLELVAPDARFEPFEHFVDEASPLFNVMNQILPRLDTGIARLGGEEMQFENIPVAEQLKALLRETVHEGSTVRVVNAPGHERFIVTRRGGELRAKKLVTYHRRTDGTEAKFEIGQESDGSQRAIDLLPAFLDLFTSASRKVYVIDEVDRSLHTMLTRRLVETYLETCDASTRTQLLLTTHDVLLMDQDLLRRDEMWVAERDESGASSLTPFSDFKDVRYDKDIRKSYLQGRLGGVPRIALRRAPRRPHEPGPAAGTAHENG
jgi:AAA15 family ATPase/GTPase